MFLWHIFRVKPLAAMSLLLCLATILACFLLRRRRPQQRTDRFLIGVLGLLSIYQGLRILESAGVVPLSIGANMDDAIELAIAAFYLIAALMLRLSTVNHLEVESAMRLARAAPPRSSRPEPAFDFSLDAISWALPQLSDGAFKLYAFLYLRAGHVRNRAPLGVEEIRLQLGKSQDQLNAHLTELEKAGAIAVNRQANSLNVEVLAHSRRNSGPIADELPRSAATLTA
ncbi:MAG TPA: hypothetical protein VMB85_28110 [Bryobacteraceae bacterium]|nr:hypothetical protein [Bryobacteraceae bacterium]